MSKSIQDSQTKANSQIDKFKDLARELETNEDEVAFDRALKKIAPKNTGPQEPNRDHETKKQS